jgi:signal transduction histidine kinase
MLRLCKHDAGRAREGISRVWNKLMNSNDSQVVRSLVLIDDDADFLHVMQRRLQAHRSEYAPSGPVKIHTFTDPVEALVNMPAEGICIVFIDYNLQESTGLEWLPKLIKTGLGPVILLTSQNDAKLAAEAFRAGAADYIAKSEVLADDDRLGRAAREAVRRFRLETCNSQLTRQLKLVNIELEGKNKRLAELTESAHQFVDDVAHDFRTPLTVIQQYASIIADGLSGPVTPRQCDHLELIVEATRDLSEMVDDFLDSSKLRARALPVDRQSHTADELFDAVVPTLEMRAQPKKITIERDIAESVGPFFADLTKASRILINLAINAIKVTPEGQTLKLHARPTDDGDVSIGVTDRGPGLAARDLEVIFERFQQLKEPQLAGNKGFGLGLSIVKYLTWLNLGKVKVESKLGQGSTFSFSLPGIDLQRILACYLETIGVIEDPPDLWKLEIRDQKGTLDASKLREMVAASCYPTDVVLLDAETQVVNALGVSRDATAWANRLRKAISSFGGAEAPPSPAQVDIKVEGPWPRDGDIGKLIETLTVTLEPRSCYAQTGSADR